MKLKFALPVVVLVLLLGLKLVKGDSGEAAASFTASSDAQASELEGGGVPAPAYAANELPY